LGLGQSPITLEKGTKFLSNDKIERLRRDSSNIYLVCGVKPQSFSGSQISPITRRRDEKEEEKESRKGKRFQLEKYVATR